LQAAIFATIYELLPTFAGAHEEQMPLPSVPSGTGTADIPSFTYGVHPRLVDRYLNMLEVKPVTGTRLVQVSFTTPDPLLSQRLANAHTTTFIRTTLENRFELTHEAREFLGKKLTDLRADVERADQALTQFRREQGVVSLEGNEDIGSERMIELNRRLTETRAKRIELESLYQMATKKDPQALALVVEDHLIQQLKTNLATHEAEYARLATTYTEAHPRLRELKTEIAEIHNRLDKEIATVLRRIESDYATARRREEALQSEAGDQQQRVIELKALEADYSFLKNEATSSRALYETVLKRLHETSIWNENAISNIDVSEPAEIPVVPSSPKRAQDLLLAAFAGLALSIGLVVFREYVDSTVKTPDDVWNVSSLPMLGLVPQQDYIDENARGYQQFVKFLSQTLILESVRANPMGSQHLVVSQPSQSGLAEFYYNIRTSLLLSQAEQPAQVVLLTSAHPHEGKTITTVNLAISLAQIGHSVVVVDADLRQGSCHTLLRRSNSYGLSHVLSGFLPLKDSIQDTTVPGLSLIARGEVPANPTRLLGSYELKGVMANLREWFDFVLVDSPPALALSDAPLLSQVSDGVLLVVRWQQTSVDAARRLVDRFDTVRANVLGVVLNGVDLGDPHYVDYRQYYRSLYAHAEEEAEKTK
jgi:capsular exopolysaccharide synthesis family protein